MGSKTIIPSISWQRIEQIIFEVGKSSDFDSLKNVCKLRKKELEETLSFLRDLSLVEEKSLRLTKRGKEFYTAKFVHNISDDAHSILGDALKEFEPVQVICQILRGRKGLRKSNIYNLLILENFISKDFEATELGSFINLLNKCSILKYNRKTGDIEILYNPKIQPVRGATQFLSPDTPYSNVKTLWEAIRKCKEYLWWFDKQFSRKGFEPLSEVADGNQIKEIRILMGKTSNVNEKMRRDFIRFEKEMRGKGIKAECRVLIDHDLYHDIHDRWILSKNVNFNVPPINSIYKGQYSEIKMTNNKPPFTQWWEEGKYLIEDWGEIARK